MPCSPGEAVDESKVLPVSSSSTPPVVSPCSNQLVVAVCSSSVENRVVAAVLLSGPFSAVDDMK